MTGLRRTSRIGIRCLILSSKRKMSRNIKYNAVIYIHSPSRFKTDRMVSRRYSSPIRFVTYHSFFFPSLPKYLRLQPNHAYLFDCYHKMLAEKAPLSNWECEAWFFVARNRHHFARKSQCHRCWWWNHWNFSGLSPGQVRG